MNKLSHRLALGTVQFGLPYGIANRTGQVMRSEAKNMLKLALENDIDTLDTAIGYGESEMCLGEVSTHGFKLITKLPMVPAGCLDVSGWAQEQISASCHRLGVERVYGLLLHSSSDLFGPCGKQLNQALKYLKRSGLVEKTGVSIYDPSELDAIAKLFRPDIIQAPLNLVDRRLLNSGWLQRLKADGVEIHVRSAFLQGLLLMPRANIPQKFERWSELWNKWNDWLAEHKIPAVIACLLFPLSFPEIDRIVVGADSVEQLNETINATNHATLDLPELQCNSEDLINPSRWRSL